MIKKLSSKLGVFFSLDLMTIMLLRKALENVNFYVSVWMMPRYRNAVMWLSISELLCYYQSWSNEKLEDKEKIG